MTIYGENPTSYFSAPSRELDPKLFEGRQLKAWVRQGIVHMLHDFLNLHYRHPELWAHPWLAGSGVSYQWSAKRIPQDLDCLVGVNFVQFRKANPEFAGLTDREIADQLNEEFRENLQLQTDNWNGYELTFYVNPQATDIRAIKPYAAYDLKYDEWTVTPDPSAAPPSNPEWDRVVESDKGMATQVTNRFNAALQAIQSSTNPALRRNAEVKLQQAAIQGNALYHEIHSNRSLAFTPEGEGYGDFHNYRWQAGKASGAIDSLRTLREYMKSNMPEVYGADLPDSSTLIRRAIINRGN